MNEDFWKRFPIVHGFNCVKMKNDIQSQIFEEIKNLSSTDLVSYFNRAGQQLSDHGGILVRDAQTSGVKETKAFYYPEKNEVE